MNAPDAVTAERIGLTWLRGVLAPAGAFGRAFDAAREPYGPGDEDAARAEAARVLTYAERFDRETALRLRALLRAVPEPAAIAVRVRAGDAPSDADLHELQRFVDTVDALCAALADDTFVPPLDTVRAILAPGREDAGGWYLADAFHPDLASARSRFAATEAALDDERARIRAAVQAQLGIEPAGDEFVVLREIYDGPAPDGTHVARETPVYRMFAMTLHAPGREHALAQLAAAEESARASLGAALAAETAAIFKAAAALGALDRLLARIIFTQAWGGCIPDFEAGRVAFRDATFAPLAEAVRASGRRYTPLTFDLHGVAVLTGPNMGGKSAALATAGFLAACVALGVPPPARRACLPLLARIAWIGGESAPERDRLLSAYGAEVVRAGEILRSADARTLVLVDEFARTTGPREGRALLAAFAEALRDAGAFALVATHFEGIGAGFARFRIAGLGGVAPRGAGLEAALDAINAAMDYRVVPAGAGAGPSDALALAKLLGLDARVVDRAAVLYEAGEKDVP